MLNKLKQIKQSPLVMLSLQGICLGSIVLCSSCAAKHLPFPEPLLGVDMTTVLAGQPVPFNGILVSPSYFENYMQWKCKEQSRC